MSAPSYVYVFGQREAPPYKVGHSDRPNHRALAFQREYPDLVDQGMSIILMIEFPSKAAAKLAEARAHMLLAEWRVKDCDSLEWFSADIFEIENAVAISINEFAGHRVDTPGKAVTVGVSLSNSLLLKLDDLRRIDPRLPGRSEMVRTVIDQMHELKYPLKTVPH